MGDEEHIYYFAWRREDNIGFNPARPRFFRVWRVNLYGSDEAVTDRMPREEAVEYCERIIKLTGGKQL